jgi:hypothetical protein
MFCLLLVSWTHLQLAICASGTTLQSCSLSQDTARLYSTMALADTGAKEEAKSQVGGVCSNLGEGPRCGGCLKLSWQDFLMD